MRTTEKFHILFAALAMILLALTLSSCGKTIAEFPDETASVSLETLPEEPAVPTVNGVRSVGELFGSYLTMYTGHATASQRGLPLLRVFTSYADVESYYDSTQADHIYAQQFTTDMASFDDEFFRTGDVLALVIDEPSSYINHTAEPIEISDSEVRFRITRHQPEASPLLDTEYHLLFTGPKGCFDGVYGLPINIEFTDVVDSENNSAYDADLFRLYYPEFTSFVYRADALTDTPDVVVDAIDGYDELVFFYDQNKDLYDLDSNFRDKIGTLYSWDICERYVLLAMIIPCKGEDEPELSEVFVNNLQIYASVSADEPDGPDDKPDSCYLLLCGIERRDLSGVDLNVVYLSVE